MPAWLDWITEGWGVLGYDLLGIVPLFLFRFGDLLLLCWSSVVNVLYASGSLQDMLELFCLDLLFGFVIFPIHDFGFGAFGFVCCVKVWVPFQVLFFS